MEAAFHEAAGSNDLPTLIRLLSTHPDLDVNHAPTAGFTPLHNAVMRGHHAVVKFLLQHPQVNLNATDSVLKTPLLRACQRRQLEIVKLLANHPRVDVNLPDRLNATPLWHVCFNPCIQAVKILLACGKDLDLTVAALMDDQGVDTETRATTLEVAKASEADIAALLERFMADPALVRHELRTSLQDPRALLVNLYSLLVFLSDGLLHLDPAKKGRGQREKQARRFFKIGQRLPIELQMVLCHKVYGSSREIVVAKEAEAGFKTLAKTLSG